MHNIYNFKRIIFYFKHVFSIVCEPTPPFCTRTTPALKPRPPLSSRCHGDEAQPEDQPAPFSNPFTRENASTLRSLLLLIIKPFYRRTTRILLRLTGRGDTFTGRQSGQTSGKHVSVS